MFTKIWDLTYFLGNNYCSLLKQIKVHHSHSYTEPRSTRLSIKEITLTYIISPVTYCKNVNFVTVFSCLKKLTVYQTVFTEVAIYCTLKE